jgi:(S)-2-hydroxy-acid oxidase
VAAKLGIPMCLSAYSTTSLEDVIAEGAGNPYAMQVSFFQDREVTRRLIQRAEGELLYQTGFCPCGYLPIEAGYKALFVSVDLPVLGNRLNEKRNRFCFPPHVTFPNIQQETDDVMKHYGAGYGAVYIQLFIRC